MTLDGVKSQVAAVIDGHELYLRTRNGRFDMHWVDPFGGETEEQAGVDKIAAPLPGTVVAVLAEEGATLEKGAPILTLEVMKMEQTLRAPYAGVLKSINKLDQQDAVPVSVIARTTASPGTEASFMQQLLGNIGRFNPTGAVAPGGASGGGTAGGAPGGGGSRY